MIARPLVATQPRGFAPARARLAAPIVATNPSSRWLTFLCLTLLGYAFFGKGWAYIGIPPFLFIGEMTLLIGLATILYVGRFDGLTRSPVFFLMALLAIWGTLRTIPYIGEYGADALRDAVIWGYGAFAVVVYCYLVAQPDRLGKLLRNYRIFCGIYVPLVPAVWAVSRYYGHLIPNWPWNDIPIIDSKGGDVLAHHAGILAFWCAGLAGKVPLHRTLVLAACIAGVGAYNRGGLLTILLVAGYCIILRPSHPVLRRMIVAGAIALTLLAVTDFRLTVPGKNREVSVNQVFANLLSIVVETGDESLSGTKEWRLNWWSDIWNYTVNGPYRWSGKGFGVNLADDDGYQGTRWQGKLRSPHNGHMTVLARAGVPGFVLWILIQFVWAHAMFRAFVRSSILGHTQWSGIFMFIGGIWLAFLINATFDVFLEGPMGGIWFWCIIGTGLAAERLYQEQRTAASSNSQLATRN